MRTTPFPARNPYDDACIHLAAEAIRSGNLYGIGGTYTRRFEESFAELYGAQFAIATSSGTAAIHTALAALDPSPGSEVITAPITDAGTIVPILYQGCVPVFADVDEHLGMDPASVESLITERTVAIIVVHLFGNASDVRQLRAIADRHQVPLLEDCSQAHVTPLDGKLLGRYGHIGMFSLQQSKHMTTGDGGVVITDDPELAERMSLFRDKGWARSGFGPRSYPILGLNYRMTELQAAVGIPQIDRVKSVVARRRSLALRIDSYLDQAVGVRKFTPLPGCEASYWCYPFFVEQWPAETFSAALKAEGIPTMPGYIGEPIYSCMAALRDRRTFSDSSYPLSEPVHDTVTYALGLCPSAEAALQRLVVFWLHEGMTDADADDVGKAIAKVAANLEPVGAEVAP